MFELLTNVRLRWRALWKRRQLDRDLEDELAFHLAMKEGAFRPTQLREDLREMWTFRAVETLWHDLRYGARLLRRSPGFTLIAIASLAIGIGANTAIFSLVDAILLKSLPVRDPQQLRLVFNSGVSRIPPNKISGHGREIRPGVHAFSSFSYPMYQSFVGQVPQFSDLIGFAEGRLTVTARGESHYAIGFFVTGNFFSVLGVNPIAGRMLIPEDDRTGARPVAVISYKYWEQRFGLDPAIVGRDFTVNGRPVTVIGITPPDFQGIAPGEASEIYVPIALAGTLQEGYSLNETDNWWVQILGRLRPGVSNRQAQAALDTVMQRQNAAYRPNLKREGDPWRPLVEPGGGGTPWRLRIDATTPLAILSSVVALVLLIACANIANLLLARGTARRREIAVRLSIGAGRWRLIRQLLTESLLLAGLGAAIGLTFAHPLAKLVLAMARANAPITLDSHLDGRTLLFTACIALVTALLFGLAPAFRATRIDLTPALKDGSGGASGSRRQLRLSRLLVIGQVALSTILLAGAGLFVRTLVNLSRIDPGFNAQRLLIFNVDGTRSGYQGDKLTELYRRIRERVAAIPYVQTVTFSGDALISGTGIDMRITVPGHDGQASAYRMAAAGQFLTAMGIPILLGRDIDERDTATARSVAVVNETFVRKYLAGRNPLGKVFYTVGPKESIEVVGVCKDAKFDNLRDEIQPTAYFSYLQSPGRMGQANFEVRTALPPMSIAKVVQQAVADIDRNVPVAEMRTQEEQIRMSLGQERLFAGLVGSFGLVASLVAALGLYGLMAYTVTRRTVEMGIRLALGAQRRDVQWMVLRGSLLMVATGLAIGIPAALALTRLVRKELYGVAPADPASFIAAGALMLAVAAAAAWIPARRASRVDPIAALRCE
jgi:predicted permease